MNLKMDRKKENLKVSELVLEHNHALHLPETLHLMVSERKIIELQDFEIETADDAGIGPKTAHELASRQVGGPLNLSYTLRDHKNYLRVRLYLVVVDTRIVDCHMYPGESCLPSHVLSYIPAEASMKYIHPDQEFRFSDPWKNFRYPNPSAANAPVLHAPPAVPFGAPPEDLLYGLLARPRGDHPCRSPPGGAPSSISAADQLIRRYRSVQQQQIGPYLIIRHEACRRQSRSAPSW
jgi:hypothetical protein